MLTCKVYDEFRHQDWGKSPQHLPVLLPHRGDCLLRGEVSRRSDGRLDDDALRGEQAHALRQRLLPEQV